ncbi:unnamed protein product [Lampetra fluviatilis]
MVMMVVMVFMVVEVMMVMVLMLSMVMMVMVLMLSMVMMVVMVLMVLILSMVMMVLMMVVMVFMTVMVLMVLMVAVLTVAVIMEPASLSDFLCSLIDLAASLRLPPHALHCARAAVSSLLTQAVAETPEVTASSPFNSDLCQGSGVTFKACCEDGLSCNPERGSRSHGFLGNLLKVLELAQRHPEATQTLHQLVSALLLSLPSIRQLLAERTYGRPTTAASPLTTPPPPISPRCVPKEVTGQTQVPRVD